MLETELGVLQKPTLLQFSQQSSGILNHKNKKACQVNLAPIGAHLNSQHLKSWLFTSFNDQLPPQPESGLFVFPHIMGSIIFFWNML